MIFNTKKDFQKWSDKMDFMLDTTIYLNKMKNKEIEVNIKKKTKYANLAGELDQYTLYSLRTVGLKKIIAGQIFFDKRSNLYVSRINCSEHEISFETNNDGPNKFILIDCEKLILRVSPDLFEIAEPQLNKNTVTFILNQKLPSPTYFLKELEKLGYPSLFIGYFGEKIPIKDISDSEYSGISIRPQQTDNTSFACLGVCFCQANNLEICSKIVLDLQNSYLIDFWHALLSIICDLEVASIKSGNIIFEKTNIINFKKAFDICSV
jgi:hypothetical protein